MGPLHGAQRPVWEHAEPPLTQQGPVEEPTAHATQRPRQRGRRRPRVRGRGAHCARRQRPIAPTRPAPARHTARRRTPLGRGLLGGWASCRWTPPLRGCVLGLFGVPSSSYLLASPPFSKCTEAIRHLSISCRNEQLHSGTWELIPGTGLPLTEKTGE